MTKVFDLITTENTFVGLGIFLLAFNNSKFNF